MALKADVSFYTLVLSSRWSLCGVLSGVAVIVGNLSLGLVVVHEVK